MGTHPRPLGDADALSVRLRAETSAIHREAEQRPFMRTFFAGDLSRAGYVAWLQRQLPIYTALETALDKHAGHPGVGDVVPSALYRSAALAADIEQLTGDSLVRDGEVTDAVARYVEHIDHIALDFPPGLLAHAWLRYLGNVGGQDVLRRLVAASVGESDAQGLRFTDYSALGEVREFFRTFHARLDSVRLTDEEKDRVVAEGAEGFRLNIALTDELAADLGLI
jgi:heme oxygenase